MKKIVFVLFFIISAKNIEAQNMTTDELHAIAMLKTFYTAYMSEFTASDDMRKMTNDLIGLRKKYCTAKCQKQYFKLVNETDGDPIIRGQDSDAKWAKTLIVKRDFKKQNKYTVSYNNDEYGADGKLHKQTTIINLLVIKDNGSFKIDEFL